MSKNPVQRIYEYLAERDAERAVRPRTDSGPRFRPSEIGGCWREIYYRLAGYEARPLEPTTLLLFNDGDLHHDSIRNLMRDAGVELGDLDFKDDGTIDETGAVQRTITFDFGGKSYDVLISGRTDGSVATDFGMDVLEIKSVGTYKFQKFANTFRKGGEKAVLKLLRDEVKERAGARPTPKHANRRFWFQFQATLLATDRTGMLVVFKNRDTGEIGFADENSEHNGVRVTADPEVQDEILRRCARVLQALEEKRPPSQEFLDGTAPCRMCNFYQHCWGTLHSTGEES